LIRELEVIDQKLIKCNQCPRLADWRESVTERKSYKNQKYWRKPVPGFGPKDARLIIIGLAPGAHGANRTGRIFTGDSSGDWLFIALYNAKLARIPTSVSKDDGQELSDTRITCAVHCAPPENKPTTEEIANCATWLELEIAAVLPTARAFLALGAIAWKSTLLALSAIGEEMPRKRPNFGHGANFKFQGSDGNNRMVIGSYHPSQQNTFTGKLTRSQLDSVVRKAGRFAHARPL